MLKRITKIKNYRIFHDWTDTSGVEFKTVNVVYVVNGSGKGVGGLDDVWNIQNLMPSARILDVS